MAAQPFATTIICTRDRAVSLARTLESICEAAIGVTEPWELVVVDNGSSDGTQAVVASFTSRLPIRSIIEPDAGLSNARNAGVRAALGRYIIWTDDDVVVDKSWLSAWIEGIKANPEGAVFGGRTEPRLEEPRQEWFAENAGRLGSLLAVRDERGWTEITPTRVPFGLSYAIRSEEQKRHRYDPELGVAPGRRRGGEETQVIRAILAEGGKGAWVWDSTVYHIIPPERQTERYIRDYYTAACHDFPMYGKKTAFFDRAFSSARCVYVLLKANALLLKQSARRNRDVAVPWHILHGRALGSLKNYAGIR